MNLVRHSSFAVRRSPFRNREQPTTNSATFPDSRYNSGMRPAIALAIPFLLLMSISACTFYPDRPARAISDATGGESLERVFWNHVKAGQWTEVDRALASNYVATTPTGTLDHAATLALYRQWQLKDYSLGDLSTELNGSTIVVTYTISLVGTVGSPPLPSTPLHMMTVWQQQKTGWVAIAHSVSQP